MSGQSPSGTRLPTIRQLASDLGLSKGTVERAYELLEADGVVERRGRAGTFVQVRTPGSATARPDLTDLDEAADALAVIARQLGVEEAVAQGALARALARLL